MLRFSVLILLFYSSSIYACLVGGTNPDSAYTVEDSNYASPDSGCSAKGTIPPFDQYDLISALPDPNTGNITCRFGNLPDTVITATTILTITGDEAYGECGGVTPEYAGVCGDGEIISDYRDPQCIDGTQFDANGNNIVTTIDMVTDTDITVTTTTDSTTNETTTVTTTTDTTTTTYTDTADGEILDAYQTDEVVTTTDTVVTDDLGVVISSDTDVTTTTHSDPEPQGSAFISNDCINAPTCSGDLIQCAILRQNWINSCAIEDAVNNISGTTGTVSGGGDCQTPPVCSGDIIQCSILASDWHNRCDTLNEALDFINAGGGSTTIDTSFTVDQVTTDIDFNALPGVGDFFGFTQQSGVCPAGRTVALSTKTFTLPYDTFCNLATGIAPLIIAFAYLIGVRNIYLAYIGT